MTYNQTKVNGVAMPLLMGCTKPTEVITMEKVIIPIYDPITQTTEYGMGHKTRTVKSRTTKVKIGKTTTTANDQKGELDDYKAI